MPAPPMSVLVRAFAPAVGCWVVAGCLLLVAILDRHAMVEAGGTGSLWPLFPVSIFLITLGAPFSYRGARRLRAAGPCSDDELSG